MTGSANCPDCQSENSVVEVRDGVNAANTVGFWCLKCNAKWIARKKESKADLWKKL